MARNIKAGKLRAGDWFHDPHWWGDGRTHPAKVIRIEGIRGGRIHLEIDDDTNWKRPWSDSYPVDEDVELARR